MWELSAQLSGSFLLLAPSKLPSFSHLSFLSLGLLTPAHSCSLLLTPAHSCSLLLTPQAAHSCSLLTQAPPHSSLPLSLVPVVPSLLYHPPPASPWPPSRPGVRPLVFSSTYFAICLSFESPTSCGDRVSGFTVSVCHTIAPMIIARLLVWFEQSVRAFWPRALACTIGASDDFQVSGVT